VTTRSPAGARTPFRVGKVRDVHGVGEDGLLMVTSNRISAYDVVMPTEIPDKGAVLTGLSVFWFERTRDVVANHLIDGRPGLAFMGRDEAGRAMLVRRLEMLPVECVVRGYLAGSGWRDYVASGAVSGHRLPAGLRQAERLAEPIFTPATKAQEGHDENITRAEAAEAVGAGTLAELERISIALYERGAERCAAAGIILADTKFEFGRDRGGRLTLADEVLTPDSSRMWPASRYAPGQSPPSFDKQYLRDWLDATGWDHSPPAPELPSEVVEGTRARYLEAYERIAGRPLAAWMRESGP
jgi:phosphoribosylaminoimidazole-succinocarboxamide synthase